MNKIILVGRLTKNPEIRMAGNAEGIMVARYSLAVDRRWKKEGEQTADFIPCIVFGKGAEFVQKYLRKGTKVAIIGRLNTGSYKNKDGNTVYTTSVIVDEHEFAGARLSVDSEKQPDPGSDPMTDENGFMKVSEDGEIPFD